MKQLEEKRPNIKDFFPDKELEEMILLYKNNQGLMNYIKALDSHIDVLTEALEEVEKKARIEENEYWKTKYIELPIADFEDIVGGFIDMDFEERISQLKGE